MEKELFTFPTVEKYTSEGEIFNNAINYGIAEAYARIENSFERAENPEDRLAYHRKPHTQGVVSRTERILRAIRDANPTTELITDRDIALGKFAASWHDTVQQWESTLVIGPDNQPQRKRKRAFFINETESANIAVRYMKTVNKHVGKVFTRKDMQTVKDAIMLTVPNFDTTLGTVTQPNFAKYKNNLVGQAVALADLGGGGMEGFATAQWESDSLFMEDNLDFAAYTNRLTDNTDRRFVSVSNKAEEAWYTNRMTSWMESQVRFSKGRYGQLQQEIISMDRRAQNAVRNLFSRYQETIQSMEDFAARRKTMDFATWTQDMQATLAHPPQYN